MSKIIELIKALKTPPALLPSTEYWRARDEAYLADSVDIHDLERRMHELDDRSRTSYLGPLLAVGMR